MKLVLSVQPGTFAVCKLEAGSEIPAWVRASSFLSISRTTDELSIVCDCGLVPEGVKNVGPWRAFKVEGPLDFALTGIVSSISSGLAEAGIPIFVVSTFDTDYILVRLNDFERSRQVLGKAFTVKE